MESRCIWLTPGSLFSKAYRRLATYRGFFCVVGLGSALKCVLNMVPGGVTGKVDIAFRSNPCLHKIVRTIFLCPLFALSTASWARGALYCAFALITLP